MKIFNKNDTRLTNQFDNINWISESGVDEAELEALHNDLMKQALPHAILKAKAFELILKNGKIAVTPEDIFQDKVFGSQKYGGALIKQRDTWECEIREKFLHEKFSRVSEAQRTGAYNAQSDFGHTSPNSKLLLQVGFSGILERIKKHSQKENLTEKQKIFYQSSEIALSAIIDFVKRLASETEKYDTENGAALYNIAKGAPSNIYEAMQLLIVYFFLHENVGAARIRTLGRLDVLLYPYFKSDIENGVFTKSEIKEMLKFFFNKFWSANVAFDLPLCIGGIDEDGNEVTNELTYLLVETYNELDIHSPKIHVRVSDKTPDDFVKLVLRCIRDGNSSFVFVNDNTIVKALTGVGIKEVDARNYTPIGCYEPCVWGREVGCTGTGGVNLAKAVEFAITDGVDLKSGKQISVKSGKINSYADFISAVKSHIRYMTECAMDYIREIEKYYGEIGPDPLLSAMYNHSVESGIDVFEGGAEYNNTSYCFRFIASLVDSVCAVKRLVFDEKRVSFYEFGEILKSNWQENEKLRLIAKSIPEKYGNNNQLADAVTKDFSDFCASLVTGKPNSRGGVFKASFYTIDHFVAYGQKTMATPDGRKDGEVLSKNLCATVGADKNGITALINSATKIDHSKFPNGIVLDVVLHPSAVEGEDGLDAFFAVLKTYFKKGGTALHGNVFNSEELKKAQANPEKYKNLQVRVCGWNAYFVNLSKAEQDCFIKQAEMRD